MAITMTGGRLKRGKDETHIVLERDMTTAADACVRGMHGEG